MPDNTIQALQETVRFIKKIHPHPPETGVVLGSGLGNFSEGMEAKVEIPYKDIPNFPVSTVEGHSGRLIFGKMNGRDIIAMAGRFHYYEGYSMQQVVFPIRVMKMLGIGTIFLSNAAGGMNSSFKVGDLMIIKDHISLFTPNPLIGANVEELGPRFPDMSEPYSPELIARAKKIAQRMGITLREGVYAGVTGPTFETRSEYRMLHQAGADAVGMSTVPEVIAARHMGLNTFAMSVITDLGIRMEENIITHEEVLEAAGKAEPLVTRLFEAMIGG